jgi:glycosyltransferase involved in cell wall biosynthesis
MKVAIVHEWLVDYSGSERVLEQMINCFPDADLFSLVDFLSDDQRGFIKGKKANTSFIQRLPFAKKHYRNYLPLMPIAIEQFDLSRYDLIISSSHAVAKGVLTGPDQLHICMCYSPIRYAWDLQHQYLNESNLKTGIKSFLARYILHRIRIWDSRTAAGVDSFIAISSFIQRRIRKVYNRNSSVMYPPVDCHRFALSPEGRQDFYVTSSRMVPYKKIDLIVRAFSEKMPNKKLIVIGDGPDFEKIKSMAGNNVLLMGFQPFEILKEKLSLARAFIFAAEEDFGIAPIEAQACGTPVIAYGKGGALETIIGHEGDNPTGVFYYEQTEDAIAGAVEAFENAITITAENCRKNAERFSVDRFVVEFKNFVDSELRKWRGV